MSIVPIDTKNRKEIIKKLATLIQANAIPISLRISKSEILLTFDNEYINNYQFDIQGFNEAIKKNPEKEKKEIKKEFYDEQKSRKLKGKINTRCASYDPNPEYIGFSIVDCNEKTDEVDRIVFHKTFDLTAVS